jgi:hypothetical protein
VERSVFERKKGQSTNPLLRREALSLRVGHSLLSDLDIGAANRPLKGQPTFTLPQCGTLARQGGGKEGCRGDVFADDFTDVEFDDAVGEIEVFVVVGDDKDGFAAGL